MNERIKELGLESGILNYVDHETPRHYFLCGNADEKDLEEFAKLIIKDCVDTLEFHGFEDAVPYIKWMATNKLGVEE